MYFETDFCKPCDIKDVFIDDIQLLGKLFLASCCASERAVHSLMIGALEAREVLGRTL